MSTPQFTLYGHTSGPNPWKVVFILNELGLTYNLISLDWDKKEHKSEPYISINPNGRVPALIDHHNNDYAIWESGAIIQYLVAKYDPEKKLHTGDLDKDMQANQYLMYQMSGFGPYMGQAMWFTYFQPGEKIQPAIDRYNNEIFRIFGVMDGILKGKDYLVDNRLTYADMSFISWNNLILNSLPVINEQVEAGKYPNFKRWHDSLVARESVQKGLELQKEEKAKDAAKKAAEQK